LVYPNPTPDKFRVRGIPSNEKVQYRLINSSGIEITKGWLNSTEEINVTDFPSGVYTLSFQSNKKISHQQVLIIRP
jgi:hypothetical protein